jgi:single-strand DNA-binding protein
VFGNRADALAKLLTKGMKVCVEGKLRWSQWEDKSGGGKRSKIEVIVDEVEFLSGSKAQNQAQPQQPNNYTNQYQNGANSASQQSQNDYYSEDCPF